MSGKGDTPRPKSVDEETFGAEWDRIFNSKHAPESEDARAESGP